MSGGPGVAPLLSCARDEERSLASRDEGGQVVVFSLRHPRSAWPSLKASEASTVGQATFSSSTRLLPSRASG